MKYSESRDTPTGGQGDTSSGREPRTAPTPPRNPLDDGARAKAGPLTAAHTSAAS